MIDKKYSRIDRLLVLALAGLLSLYGFVGVLRNDLYIPYKFADGGVHFSGVSAWTFAGGLILIATSLLTRIGLNMFVPEKYRTPVELAQLFLGIGLLMLGGRLSV